MQFVGNEFLPFDIPLYLIWISASSTTSASISCSRRKSPSFGKTPESRSKVTLLRINKSCSFRPCEIASQPSDFKQSLISSGLTLSPRANATSDSTSRFLQKLSYLLRNQPDFISDRSQSNVGIILPQENPILGTRSEHTIRLIHPFGHQVVDQYPDVGFVACQYQRFLPILRRCALIPAITLRPGLS